MTSLHKSKLSHNDYEDVEFLFKKDNYEVSSNKDIFRHPSAKIISASPPSSINNDELFDCLSSIFQLHGLSQEQATIALTHPSFQSMFLQAFTHYSYLPQTMFHLSNDYLERIGSYILDKFILQYLFLHHKLENGISCQDRYSLVLQWMQKEHKAASWLDLLGLTKFIRWSPIILQLGQTTRTISCNDTVKWSVLLAFIAVTVRSINICIKPGLGHEIAHSMLQPFYSLLNINITQMHRYKDAKSQIAFNLNKKFSIKEVLHVPTQLLSITITLFDKQNTSTKIEHAVPHQFKLFNWKLPIYEKINTWLQENGVNWNISTKRD